MSKKIEDENGNVYVQKKPFYKRVWFWIVVIIILGGIGSQIGSSDTSTGNNKSDTASKAINSSSSKKASGITKSKFDQIKLSETDGTSLSDVEKSFGKKPSSTSTDTIQDVKTDMNTWTGVANAGLGSTIAVGFSNGHAVSKAISELKVNRSEKIDLNKFNSITNGMSADDVKKSLGEPNGLSITSIAGTSAEDWTYSSGVKGDMGANCIITFQDGVVSGKSQTGLKADSSSKHDESSESVSETQSSASTTTQATTNSNSQTNVQNKSQSQTTVSNSPKKINGAGPGTTSSEPKDTDMVSIGNGSYSQYNDPNSQTDTPKEEHDLEEYVKAHQNDYDD
ncbi:DUF3862 domain-containing protein [Pediococcus pentosaceus]|uniref:DUF3862 domain-containing protein n=1 Tax=Pediococcus pentosaceus TaxID=1255 RepID=UPI002017A0D2|nr:DUF3862 domain-containing protein [Pediococcus pentosaceus]MCL3857896.1 DUF3862 domain-containing protein [Pediococcus pentosaceus]